MKRLTTTILALLLMTSIFTALLLPTLAAPLASHIGIVKARGGLRLREEATTSSNIIDTAHYGDSVVVIEKKGDWYKVLFNLQEGYMSGDYLTLKEKENIDLGTGSVDASVVNVRSAPNTDSEIVHQVRRNDKVEIFGFNCGWYKVTSKNEIGYIRSDLVKMEDMPAENYGVNRESTVPMGSGNSNAKPMTAGEKLAAYAKTFVGYPYVYGGSSPSGFDCSGFMQYVCRQMGYTIKRTATSQLSNGVKVSKSELQPGDLVFFGYGSSASHVGMYIGNDKFVHAENSRTGVVISDLFSGYYGGRYLTARRITG